MNNMIWLPSDFMRGTFTKAVALGFQLGGLQVSVPRPHNVGQGYL